MIGFLKITSIRQGIIAISTFTSGIVLLIAATTMMLSDFFKERSAIVQSTAMLSNLVEINAGATLVFRDPEAAAEVLSVLRAEQNIATALIYSDEGELFAKYISERPQHRKLQAQTSDNERAYRQERLNTLGSPTYTAVFRPMLLDFSAPIRVDGETVGVLNMQVDLEPMTSWFYRLAAYTVIFLFLSFLLAFLLSRRLQRSVTDPINNFSTAMREVSESGDYSRRLEYIDKGELGMLGSSFNSMLQQIQDRDEQLEGLVDELKSATLAKSHFLANMSHEIRTPMNSIIGITSLLLDMPLSEKQKTYFEIIQRSAQSLTVIINDILDISKIEAGHLSMENLEFKLEEVILNVTNTFRQPARIKSLSLEVNIAPGTPAYVLGDSGRLQQVLINLVGNAIKFTPAGSVVLSVSIKQQSDANTMLLFEVTDTGIGIAKHAQKRIFHEFTQADESTTRRFGGTGLGLSFSKHIVERMQGQIGLESIEGKGSRFWFTLPVNQSFQNSEHRADTLTTPQATAKNEKKVLALSAVTAESRLRDDAKILIVDDSKPNRFILTETMKNLGLDVVAAECGKEAVELVRRHRFDLVIMDIQMPVMDGMEATRKIRKSERENGMEVHLPIIAFSANAMEGDRERFLQAGMDDYLSKPIQMEAFMAVLHKWLGQDNEH